MKSLLPAAGILAAALLLTACSPSTPSGDGATTAAPMETDLAATLAAQPEFYVFRTEADVPADLEWQDGSNLPEFSDPNARKGGTFNFFISDFPRTLRPFGPDATGGIRPWLLDDIAIPFTEPHPNIPDAYYPGTARRWAIGADGRTVFFELDPDARWSDGEPVTTRDVVFMFYFFRSPHITEPWYNDFYTKNYDRVTVYSDRVFALTLPERRPDILLKAGNLTVLPRHAMQDFGPDFIQRYDWRVLPTTGAYTIANPDRDVQKGRSVTLSRVQNWWAENKRFWRHRFNPDRVRLEVIRDPNKAFESFARGDLDLFGLNLPRFWYEQMPDTHPEVAGGYIVKAKFFNQIPRPDWGLWINTAQPLLSNRDVRIGIHHAANFDTVCQNFYRGDAVRLQTRSDGYPFRVHPTITARPFDIRLAREAFARAGFTTQGPDGILVNDAGQRLSFTLTTYAQTVSDVMTILADEARRAGLELRLEVLDATTGWKKVQEKQHDIALIALSRSVEPFPRYWEMYHSSNAYMPADAEGNRALRVQTNNMTSTALPELDALIAAYDKAETMDEVKRIAAQIEEVIHEHASWVPGWALPFYRLGYWRWVRWPEQFNGRSSRDPIELHVFWIDEEAQRETQEARRAGRTFPPQVLTFDAFRTP